jgi:Mn-dependent DtxR family transcriptional regulator
MKEVKEVKTFKKEVKKDVLLNIIFVSLKAGKTTKQIRKELNISKQKLQYYLNKLKSENKIKKIGYGVWQTSKDTVGSSCRGHGFMWHLKLPQEIKVWSKILEQKKIPYKLINTGHTYQIYLNNIKLWLSKNSIVIYDIGSYFGYNAVESRKLGFFALRRLLIKLESKLGIRLTKKGQFIIKPSRQHYSLIKNCLAVQCNESGEKINVYNEKGIWFTIDNSFNLEEAETIHPKTALTDSLGIQKYFNEHKETHFEVTPKFVLESLGKMIQVQQMNADNIIKHQKVLDEMLIALKAIQEKL